MTKTHSQLIHHNLIVNIPYELSSNAKKRPTLQTLRNWEQRQNTASISTTVVCHSLRCIAAHYLTDSQPSATGLTGSGNRMQGKAKAQIWGKARREIL